ncbi:MAG: hypothetical protein ACRDRT_14245, partial [Pseudonocardiaceae bacterium]
ANIIAGMVIDDAMGDEVRVTVIAAGFDRWEEGRERRTEGRLGDRVDRGRGREPERSREPERGREAERGRERERRAPLARDDLFGPSRSDHDVDLGDDDDDFDVPSFLR